jgi:predicted nucleic acid-binding protein
VARLLSEGHEVCVCPQNLIEFWAVATRPLEANGLGRTPDEVVTEISDIQARFVLPPDIPEIFTQWKTLVQSGSVRGQRTHDARLAAVYQTHRVQALLTFNPTDFAAFPRLHLLDPM